MDAAETVSRRNVEFNETALLAIFPRGFRRFMDRERRREGQRSREAILAWHYVQKLLYHGLKGHKRMEREAQISPEGWTCVFGLIYWAPKMVREAAQALVGFIGWNVDLPSATRGGLSAAQLPPDKGDIIS